MVQNFHQLIEESGGDADEISFTLGFQEHQELLATGWQLRRCIGARVTYTPSQYDTNAKNEVWLQAVLVCSMVHYQLSVRREAQIQDDGTWN